MYRTTFVRMNLYTTLFHGDREKARWIIDHVVMAMLPDLRVFKTSLHVPTVNNRLGIGEIRVALVAGLNPTSHDTS